jgi:hypothetical protein
MAVLTVRYSRAYPDGMRWMWRVVTRLGVFTGWRATYPEALLLGLEDLAHQEQEEARMMRALRLVPGGGGHE